MVGMAMREPVVFGVSNRRQLVWCDLVIVRPAAEIGTLIDPRIGCQYRFIIIGDEYRVPDSFEKPHNLLILSMPLPLPAIKRLFGLRTLTKTSEKLGFSTGQNRSALHGATPGGCKGLFESSEQGEGFEGFRGPEPRTNRSASGRIPGKVDLSASLAPSLSAPAREGGIDIGIGGLLTHDEVNEGRIRQSHGRVALLGGTGLRPHMKADRCTGEYPGEKIGAARAILFSREALPPLAVLEREWRVLEAAGHPSFFTSWRWIGTLLTALPPASRPQLLRGIAQGETVALALLGACDSRRQFGLVHSRGLHINETGDPRFDSLTIEHNGILAVPAYEPVIWDNLLAWFAGLSDEGDELHLSGSFVRLPAEALRRYGLASGQTAVPSFSVDLARLEQTGGEVDPC